MATKKQQKIKDVLKAASFLNSVRKEAYTENKTRPIVTNKVALVSISNSLASIVSSFKQIISFLKDTVNKERVAASREAFQAVETVREERAVTGTKPDMTTLKNPVKYFFDMFKNPVLTGAVVALVSRLLPEDIKRNLALYAQKLGKTIGLTTDSIEKFVSTVTEIGKYLVLYLGSKLAVDIALAFAGLTAAITSLVKGKNKALVASALLAAGVIGIKEIEKLINEVMGEDKKPEEEKSKELSGDNKTFFGAVYGEVYSAAKNAGLPNPEVIAGLGASQSSLETGFGKSAPNNNYFGIKATGAEGGEQTTQEWNPATGKMETVKAKFRKYSNISESAADYVNLLSKSSRYKDVVAASTVEEAITAQGKSGYATDPNYSNKLMGIYKGMTGGTGVARIPGQNSAAVTSVTPSTNVAAADSSVESDATKRDLSVAEEIERSRQSAVKEIQNIRSGMQPAKAPSAVSGENISRLTEGIEQAQTQQAAASTLIDNSRNTSTSTQKNTTINIPSPIGSLDLLDRGLFHSTAMV